MGCFRPSLELKKHPACPDPSVSQSRGKSRYFAPPFAGDAEFKRQPGLRWCLLVTRAEDQLRQILMVPIFFQPPQSQGYTSTIQADHPVFRKQSGGGRFNNSISGLLWWIENRLGVFLWLHIAFLPISCLASCYKYPGWCLHDDVNQPVGKCPAEISHGLSPHPKQPLLLWRLSASDTAQHKLHFTELVLLLHKPPCPWSLYSFLHTHNTDGKIIPCQESCLIKHKLLPEGYI